jgi:hypothetical protein
MKALFLSIVMVLLFVTPVFADDFANQLLINTQLADLKQTLDIKNHPGMYEMNPILGRNPSDDSIKTYFFVIIAGNQMIINNEKLPLFIRKTVLYSSLIAELWCLQNNVQNHLDLELIVVRVRW